MTCNRQILGACVALSVARNVAEVSACGVDWNVPKDHFNGVNEQGYVSYWDQIGTFDLGEDLKIPLVIGFESNRETSSSWLGKGWIFGILDSNLVALDEQTFRLVGPDGYSRLFYRDRKDPWILDGGSAWKGEIKDDTVTLSASCGWKLIYTRGKLTSIVTPKNRRLDLARLGERMAEVRENGVTLLRTEVDVKTGRVKELVFRGGKRIVLEQEQKPRVQQINGQNMVGGMDYSLSKVMLTDGTVKTFRYGVNDKLQPTFKTEGRLITWDPQTRRILKDGEWIYDIKLDEKNPLANAAIGRRDSRGLRNFWFHDVRGGKEVESANGMTVERSWFVGGNLAGKLRLIKMRDERTGSEELLYRASYDESGNLIRVMDHGEITTFVYGSDGRLVAYRSSRENFTVNVANVLAKEPKNSR